MSDTNAKSEKLSFQSYACARGSARLITPEGRRITFTNGQYITDNEEEIAYLDEEIKKGLPSITKGEKVASNDRDPMTALRRQIIKDYLAEEAKQLEESRDMGSTNVDALSKLKPATTADAKTAAASNSK